MLARDLQILSSARASRRPAKETENGKQSNSQSGGRHGGRSERAEQLHDTDCIYGAQQRARPSSAHKHRSSPSRIEQPVSSPKQLPIDEPASL